MVAELRLFWALGSHSWLVTHPPSRKPVTGYGAAYSQARDQDGAASGATIGSLLVEVQSFSRCY